MENLYKSHFYSFIVNNVVYRSIEGEWQACALRYTRPHPPSPHHLQASKLLLQDTFQYARCYMEWIVVSVLSCMKIMSKCFKFYVACALRLLAMLCTLTHHCSFFGSVCSIQLWCTVASVRKRLHAYRVTLTFSWKIISLSLLMCGFHRQPLASWTSHTLHFRPLPNNNNDY